MVQILDDEHLETLQCSRCHKYLSMFPVKNHSNRDVTCGRCSGIDADKDDSVRSTLYELVAEKYLFKCVNRFEGCRKLLRADETEDHEKECVGNVFNCPKCEDGIETSVLELIWHYRLQHPSSYLKRNNFYTTPPEEDVMLYIQDDVVFFIFVRYSLKGLRLSATTLSETKVTQSFKIVAGSLSAWTIRTPCKSMSDPKREYFNAEWEPVEVVFSLEVSKRGGKLYDVSVPSTSKDVDRTRSEVGSTASVSKEMKFRVQMSKKLETKMGYKLNDSCTALLHENGRVIDLTCSNCKQLIEEDIYRCEVLEHQICSNCSVWCGICDTDDVYVKKKKNTSQAQTDHQDELFYQVREYLMFPCRWKCGKYFISDFSHLEEHEKSCELRIINCPMCSSEIKSLNVFDKHLLNVHQVLNFCGDYEEEVNTNLFKKKRNGELSFLFHNKYCYLKWFQIGNDPCYDFHFGLFKDDPNIKLCMIDAKKSRRVCCHNIIQNVKIHKQYYLPYINFNNQ